MTLRVHILLILLFLFQGLGFSAKAWSPGTGSPNAVEGFAVDPTNRTDVLAFYQCVYTRSESYPGDMAWTGNVGAGVAGTTSATFKDDVRRRINFYRALVTLPGDIVFDATKSSKDQDDALMMSRNNDISHTPPMSWVFYTSTGAEAAGNSNIALGTYGPGSVDAYMREDGSNNVVVGHRRWLHYSRGQIMGTGDVPENGSYNSANAIWVIGDFKPAPAPKFVAWPNHGFVPFAFMPDRWSLSYPGANFANASVAMTQGGNNVPVTIISKTDNGYGDNTIVWTPIGLPTSINADTTYNITVTGISGSGIPTSYNYTVTLFDPNVLGDSVSITGNSSPPTTGASYTFNSIAQADSYELAVSKGSTASWTEGAEDSPTPQIVTNTTGTYPVRQSGLVRTGSKAFQLTFPDFEDQSFTVTRDIIPSATSQLQFYDRARFSTTTSTLSAEVSTDNGNHWTSLWSRNGVGLSSANWDPAFISRSISLSAYAGQAIRVRFILRSNNNSITIGTTSSYGFFIDDMTITNATELLSPTVTALPGNATSFTLNATTAGSALIEGTSYYLRIRPNVGTHWFGYGAFKVATAVAPSGYATWVANQYPSVTEGTNGDHDGDSLGNGLEYAFGFNPTVSTSPASLPQPSRIGNSYTVTFSQPAGVTGVTYGAQWSTDLVNWSPVTDSGSGTSHTFSVNTTGLTKVFFRYQITVAP